MKLFWVTQENRVLGNALGYNTHNKFIRKHAEKYFDLTPDADIALTITPANFFTPIPGKYNVLFTMWEFLDLPNNFIRGVDRTDALIVPSTFCRDLFHKYFKGKIYVCHLGVEPELFPYKLRNFNDEKLRLLWVGAPNPRKGYPLILQLIKVFENNPNVEIYLKTTVDKMEWRKFFINIWHKRRDILFDRDAKGKQIRVSLGRILRRLPRPQLANRIYRYGKHKNIVLDTRMLPFEELQALYDNSHIFLFPTFGEGWGLPLCEAMASGLPSVATAVTGCKDFFDDSVGYTINHTIKEHDLRDYELKCNGYVPDVQDFCHKVLYILTNYKEAQAKAVKASERIHSKFTWAQSGKRLADIIKEIQDDIIQGR